MKVGPYASAAWLYRAAGWTGVLPLPERAKWPPPSGYTGWAGVDPSGADVAEWIHGPEGAGNIALRLPHGVYGLDVDAYGEKTGGGALAAALGNLGPLPDTWVVTSRDDGVSGIRLFSAYLPPGRRRKDEPAGHGAGIEAIHFGHRYAVVWPSVHPETERKYRWHRPDGSWAQDDEVPNVEQLPEMPRVWVDALSELGEASTAEAASHAETLAAVSGFPAGEACDAMREACERAFVRLREARDGAALHPAGRDATKELVSLGHEGHADARKALAEHYSMFVDVRMARGESQAAAGSEWWRMVRGAVGKLEGAARGECDCALRSGEGVQFDGGEGGVGGMSEAPTWESLHATEILEEGKRLRVRDTARGRYESFKHGRDWAEPVVHGPLCQELLIPDTDPQWRIEGILGNGHNAILVAGRKAGKTTLINDLVRAYVDDEDFLATQRVVPSGRGIAIFNYEVDERQYRRWLREVGVSNADRVHVMHLRGRTLPMLSPQICKWVTQWLAERDIGLWTLDPYSRAYLGSVQNGNDEAQVSAFLDILDVIKADAGVSELVMSVHTPKARVEDGAETAIGSQRLEGWPDVMWFLTRDGRQRYLRAEGRDVEVTETQLDYNERTRRLALRQFGTDRRAARETAKATKQAAEQAADLNKLVELVRSDPGCTTNKIRDGLGFNAMKIGSLVATSNGRIVIEPGSRRSQMHYLKEDVEPSGTLGRDQIVPLASHPVPLGVSSGGTTPKGGSPIPLPLTSETTIPPANPFDLDGGTDDHA